MVPKTFSWRTYEQMSRALQSLGYLVIVFGPLSGIALFIFGDSALRISGLVVIVASFIVALYHFSFSLLMDAIRDLKSDAPTTDSEASK